MFYENWRSTPERDEHMKSETIAEFSRRAPGLVASNPEIHLMKMLSDR